MGPYGPLAWALAPAPTLALALGGPPGPPRALALGLALGPSFLVS